MSHCKSVYNETDFFSAFSAFSLTLYNKDQSDGSKIHLASVLLLMLLALGESSVGSSEEGKCFSNHSNAIDALNEFKPKTSFSVKR